MLRNNHKMLPWAKKGSSRIGQCPSKPHIPEWGGERLSACISMLFASKVQPKSGDRCSKPSELEDGALENHITYPPFSDTVLKR